MKFSQTMLAALLASALMFTLTACERQGPFEEAGENVDEAMDNAGDSFDDATDGR